MCLRLCVVKTGHSFLLNVTLLNSILYPNCSFVHICLCSHFGWTNVCFSFFVFCLISHHFFFFLFFWFWMWRHGFGFPSFHEYRCRLHCRCVDVDAVHCPLPCCTHLVSNTTWRPPSCPYLCLHPKSLFCLFFNLFLPLVLFFFSILVSDSTRQSWESTMPLPVSKYFFRGRVKGSLQTIIYGIGERCHPNLIKPVNQLLIRLILFIFSSSARFKSTFLYTFIVYFFYPFSWWLLTSTVGVQNIKFAYFHHAICVWIWVSG